MKDRYEMTHPQALEVLELQSGASKKRLKSAYRKMARKHHPDKGGDPKNFIIVKVAYDMLTEHGTTPKPSRPITRGFNFVDADPFAGISIKVSYVRRRCAV